MGLNISKGEYRLLKRLLKDRQLRVCEYPLLGEGLRYWLSDYAFTAVRVEDFIGLYSLGLLKEVGLGLLGVHQYSLDMSKMEAFKCQMQKELQSL